LDTKWNDLIDKIYDYVLKRWENLLGGACIIVGIYTMWFALGFLHLPTKEDTYTYTILCNIFIGLGVYFTIKGRWERKIKAWNPDSEAFYQEWKLKKNEQKKKMLKSGMILFLIVVVVDWITYPMRFVTTLTFVIQFALLNKHIDNRMCEKLDELMVQMEELNRKNLEKALEIERKSMEKVAKSDQLRMDLVTNVSHDLKTPLTSMVGYLELLKKEELSDVVRDYVDVIVDKTDKLKEMIDSLFSLAKASSGNVELHKEMFEVNRLIEQIMADMKDRIDESELDFITILSKESTQVISDNMYFYRICQNLFENALKYSAKGTRVFIKTSIKENGNVGIEITNTAGYLMDFEKEEILEKFVRGDKNRSTEGNGLGLAIVSTYSKTLGGQFDIQIDCDQFKACLEFPKSI